MTRWEPGAAERLAQAALDLYAERGFEQTTVAEIAKRAGLTERTFFRHYADKREVLFAGGATLQEVMVRGVLDAPAAAAPIAAVAAGLQAGAEVLEGRRDFAGRRAAVIAASAELQERELIKMSTLGAALADALRGRRVAEPTASLTAQAGIAVFHVAFARWIEEGTERELAAIIRESLDELKAVTAGAR
ncbi:MAG TPA: TetR family transcriptional regulator [Solirubrobacteraceae bacterium]|nr:TetR family transcriptional regulator [Solirubrobacteraceae bacterium]